jgi:hypothetical protein
VIDPKLKNAIIIVVTAVWAVNFVAGLAVPKYEPDQAINAIFMGIVGGLFALGARDKNDPKGGAHKPSDPPAKDETDAE